LWASWMEPGTEELMTMDATRRAPGRHLLWRPLFHSQNTLLGTCLMTLLCRPTRFINSGLRSMAACAGARRDPGDLQWPPAVLHPVSGRHGVPQQLPPLILPRNSILSPPSSILSSPPLATTSPRQPDAVLPAVDMHQEGVRLLIVSDIAQVRRRRMNGVTGPALGPEQYLGAIHHPQAQPTRTLDSVVVVVTRSPETCSAAIRASRATGQCWSRINPPRRRPKTLLILKSCAMSWLQNYPR